MSNLKYIRIYREFIKWIQHTGIGTRKQAKNPLALNQLIFNCYW